MSRDSGIACEHDPCPHKVTIGPLDGICCVVKAKRILPPKPTPCSPTKSTVHTSMPPHLKYNRSKIRSWAKNAEDYDVQLSKHDRSPMKNCPHNNRETWEETDENDFWRVGADEGEDGITWVACRATRSWEFDVEVVCVAVDAVAVQDIWIPSSVGVVLPEPEREVRWEEKGEGEGENIIISTSAEVELPEPGREVRWEEKKGEGVREAEQKGEGSRGSRKVNRKGQKGVRRRGAKPNNHCGSFVSPSNWSTPLVSGSGGGPGIFPYNGCGFSHSPGPPGVCCGCSHDPGHDPGPGPGSGLFPGVPCYLHHSHLVQQSNQNVNVTSVSLKIVTVAPIVSTNSLTAILPNSLMATHAVCDLALPNGVPVSSSANSGDVDYTGSVVSFSGSPLLSTDGQNLLYGQPTATQHSVLNWTICGGDYLEVFGNFWSEWKATEGQWGQCGVDVVGSSGVGVGEVGGEVGGGGSGDGG